MTYKPKKVNLQVEFDPEPSPAEKAEAEQLAEMLAGRIRVEAQSALEDHLDNGGGPVNCHYEQMGGSWYLVCE